MSRALAGLFAGLLLAGGVAGQDPPMPADAVAVVGSTAITRAQLQAEVARGMVGNEPARALEMLVMIEVLRQGLAGEGFDPAKVSDADIQAVRAHYLKSGVPKEQLDKRSRLELAIPLCMDMWLRDKVSDAELRRRWDERRVALMGKLRARAVVVRPGKEQDLSAAVTRAKALLAEIGGTDPGEDGFTKLARQRSDDPAAAVTGGDLDWFGRDGRTLLGERLEREVVRACFERAKPGLLDRPILLKDEVWLVRVSAVHVPPDAKFEEHVGRIRAEAEMELREEAQEDWRRKIRVRYAADAPRLSEDVGGRD